MEIARPLCLRAAPRRSFGHERTVLTLKVIVAGGYNELYEWSIENISEFWENVWHFTDIKYSTCYSQVSSLRSSIPGVTAT